MKTMSESSRVDSGAGRLLSVEELEQVGGGWCGTPVPGVIPIPEPDPEPWHQMTTVNFANVATFGHMIVSRPSIMRF